MKLTKSGHIDDGSFAKLNENEIIFREEKLSPSKLKENPKNLFDRLSDDDYKRLKNDIAERGIIDPLICDKNFILLTGHNRLAIAKELRLEFIPVRILQTDLSAKEKEKLLVLDNLNRRQLSPEEKKKFIALYYKDELLKDNRGGNQYKKDESSNELSKDLSKKIEKETGIKAGTAKRIISEIKKESKTRTITPINKVKKIPNTGNPKKPLLIKLKNVEQEITRLKKQIEKLEAEKVKLNRLLNALK
jgi:polyhydroxyalkanoate synthesis regulator phasin